MSSFSATMSHMKPGGAAAAAAPAFAPSGQDSDVTSVNGQPQHFLQRIQLFSALTVEECQAIVKKMKRRDFPPNQPIVREGAPGNSMFFITSGLVEIRKKDPQSGIEFLLTEMGPGQNFGEMSLLTGKPRSATVNAVQPTTCAILEAPSFQEIIFEYPKMALALTKIMAERVESASQHVGIEFVNLGKVQIDKRILDLLPHSMMLQHKILPVSFANNRLSLGMTNPNNILALDDVRRVIKGVLIEPVVVAEDDFRKFMATTYAEHARKKDAEASAAANATAGVSVSSAPAKTAPVVAAVMPTMDADLLASEIIKDIQLTEDTNAQLTENKQDLMNASEDAPIIRLGNSILGLAIKRGASDIHIEPMEREVLVRFRIDGVLQTVQNLPKKVQLGLISRLKILSKLDISEKRLPQDGRISVTMEGKPIDFRVSSIPAKWGEKICMRILDKSNTSLGLDKLVSHAPTLELIRSLINEPYGIMYVTGPTGSGKTTTLYSALTELNDPGVNISTAEDPIEYDLGGINQVQANKDIGLDFARILRAFLRQDPDIILVGETRDRETAHIAVEAALTGHLVFTTLHTNSAAGAFTRLMEMEVEPFLISSSTIGVMAQRLARRNCPVCREEYVADDQTCEFMGLPAKSKLWKGTGKDKSGGQCLTCGGKGVKGRVGIYEVLKMNAELRNMVAKRAITEDIHRRALELGMLDLKRYAGLLLLNGDTNVDEVLQVVSVQE